MQILEKITGGVISHAWRPKPRKEQGDDQRLAAIRLKAINVALRGKPAKADIDEVNELIGDRPVAVYTRIARELAVRAESTSNLRADELLDVLRDGPGPALFRLVEQRKAAWEEFQQTDYSKRLRELTAKRDAAIAAWKAVEHDEDVGREKKIRLRNEMEQSALPLNALLNSNDPELVAYRDKMKLTADPTMNELAWESFAI